MAYESVKDLMTAICDEVRRLTDTGSLIPHLEIPERLKGVGGGAGDYTIKIKLVKKGTDILLYDVITISGPEGMSWSISLPEISGYKPIDNIETVSDIVSGDEIMIIEYRGLASEGLVYTIVTEDENTYAICGTDTSINNNAWGTCTDSAVVIAEDFEGYNVEKIGRSAFYGNKNFNSVIIPATVTLIGANAFNGCSAIESVELSRNCTLTNGSFVGCTSLKSIFIPIGTKTSAVSYGPFSSTSGAGSIESVELENGITLIPSALFYNCPKITAINIPSTVTEIGANAFSKCTGLISVSLPQNCTLSNGIFVGCTSLKNIFIPIGTKTSSTAYGPFSSSSGAGSIESVEFENGLIEIPSALFYNCQKLTSVIIPNTVTSIKSSAFYNCKSLTSIDIPSSVSSIESSAFNGCSALESIELPQNLVLGQQAFANCTSIKSIFVPLGLTYGSSSWYPFANSGIENISFATGTSEISDGLFGNCKNLKSVVIPDTVTLIGSSVFYGCSALESVELSRNCTLTNSSFVGCTSLKNIFIPIGTKTSSTAYGPFSSTSGGGSIESVEFENGLIEIPSALFYNCQKITSVIIPDTVTSIKSSAFYNCKSLTSVDIPSSVSSIENSAFNGCPIEGTITLGGVGHPVTSIGSNAFKNSTTTAIEVYVADGVTSLKNQPWGASVASVTYRSAVTGEIVSA